MEIKEVISEILENTYVLNLATSKDNKPWSSVLAFVHDKDFNIYWLSDPKSKHSIDLLDNPIAAISLTQTSDPENANVGLQMIGKVESLGNNVLELHNTYLEKRSHLIYAPRHQVQGFLESWYKFIPEFIDVIYEPEWAYEKKRYMLDK